MQRGRANAPIWQKPRSAAQYTCVQPIHTASNASITFLALGIAASPRFNQSRFTDGRDIICQYFSG